MSVNIWWVALWCGIHVAGILRVNLFNHSDKPRGVICV